MFDIVYECVVYVCAVCHVTRLDLKVIKITLSLVWGDWYPTISGVRGSIFLHRFKKIKSDLSILLDLDFEYIDENMFQVGAVEENQEMYPKNMIFASGFYRAVNEKNPKKSE